MTQSTELDSFNVELQKAQVEADEIDAELARLQRGDPSTPFRFFNLVARRRLIGERLLAAVEELGSTGSLAPAMPMERNTESDDSVAASAGPGPHHPNKTHHRASYAVG